jgi:hypothetical protein
LGTASAPVSFCSASTGVSATIASSAGGTFAWAAFRDITATGGAFNATNSADQGHNSGITITPPAAGGMHYTNDMGGNLG